MNNSTMKLPKVQVIFTLGYLNDKHDCQMREKDVQKENKLLRKANESMQSTLKEVKSRTQQKLQITELEKDKNADEVMERFRGRVKGNEESLQIIKEQYLKLQQVYLGRIRALEESLESIRRRHRLFAKKRKQEVDNFYRDIEGVKRKTRIYDSYLHRVKRLIDKNPKEIIGMCNK